MRKILVLRGGALGDFIVTLPALVALHRHWPQAAIELAGNATAAAIARARGILSAVHSQHESRWSALYRSEPLPNELTEWLASFDLILSYWPDPEHSLKRHLPAQPGQEFVCAPAIPNRAPAAAHYIDCLRQLGITSEAVFCRIRDNDIEAVTPVAGAADIRPAASKIAVHPGSGSRLKNWPADRWLEFLARVARPTLLITGEAEAERWDAARLAKTSLQSRLADGTLQILPSGSLERLTQQLSLCRAFVGHDSGVSHLAAACGVPSLLLFGPTDPTVWAPPAPHVHVLRRGNSLDAITVDDVLSSFAAINSSLYAAQ